MINLSTPNSNPVLGSAPRRALRGLSTFIVACATVGSKIVSNLIANMQMGRMVSVLSAMSNEELKQIGVERSNIPQQAKYLTS